MENCRRPEPYPPMEVAERNLTYAKILARDYAGTVSEMTAITQYVYHNLDIGNKEVSDLMMCIARVEMHHLHMLGTLIKKLGGDPRYEVESNYWNAGFVKYGRNMCQQITLDIDAEYAAIRQYKLHLTYIDDPFVKEVIKRIIMDEEYHIKLFTGVYEKYCKNK